MDFAPAHTAPDTAAMEANSSSIWINIPPIFGNRSAIRSATSVEGVIGYPAMNLQPPAMAPSAQA